jgi:phosphoglycerate dehydrogenase-like enzyme
MSPESLKYLEQNDCRISHRKWDGLPEEEICWEIQGMDAVIAGNEPYTRKVFEAANKLKIVARAGIGYDSVDLAAATEHGVQVTNTPIATSPAVADFTICLILCLLRNIHAMAQETERGTWKKFLGRDLGALTLGIVGAGAIGRRVVKRARAFGTTVLAHDVQPDEAFAAEWNVDYVPLDDLMSRSDVVSIHVPLNEDTRGFINEKRLKLMKKTAYLIDTSRPTVVDRGALLKALQAKEIAGAALDVHDPIPCEPNDPLVQLENVLVTPWSAAYTEETLARVSITAAKDVVAVLQGRAPTHPLNEVANA